MHPSTPVSVHMCTYIHVWVYVLYMSRNTRNIRIGLAGPSTYVIYIYNIYMCTLKPFSVSTTSVPFAISFWFSLVSLTHKCVVTELDSNEQPLCSRRWVVRGVRTDAGRADGCRVKRTVWRKRPTHIHSAASTTYGCLRIYYVYLALATDLTIMLRTLVSFIYTFMEKKELKTSAWWDGGFRRRNSYIHILEVCTSTLTKATCAFPTISQPLIIVYKYSTGMASINVTT